MVYFDNWAWRLFSESQEIQDRFLRGLKQRNGTLAISWFGLMEFSILTDCKHGRAADRLLEAAFPNVLFLHSDFLKVAQAEEKGLATGISPSPYADDEFFGKYMSFRLKNGPIGLRQLFQTEDIRRELDELLANIVNRIESFRKKTAENLHDQAVIERYRACPRRHYTTGFMLRELLRVFIINRKKR
jgi:hypothetical protein